MEDSGWTSPVWNWGSASGTGHDCVAICRRRYATRKSRADLVDQLLHPVEYRPKRLPANFEEVKLVLALAWQKGRWDGSDIGPYGYGAVLSAIARAERYELGSEEGLFEVKDLSLNDKDAKVRRMDVQIYNEYLVNATQGTAFIGQ